VNYVIFALDITYDRDFWTWMWLGTAAYFAINTHVAYKKFKSTKGKTENECEVLNIPRVSVAVCPKCKSKEVYYWINEKTFECDDCNEQWQTER
jgi:DNA-directed RNA polymerase subunit M/transcription elongation factor TFIIS